jgi:hypothetical protein
MEARLCPKCGAYWQCDCRFDELSPLQDDTCPHDWAEAVGVELDLDLDEERQVLVCRLCGLYTIGKTADSGERST